MSGTIKVDNKEYEIESLSDDTKAHLVSIQAVDRRLKDLKEQTAILQTARVGYTTALKTLLAKDMPDELN